ncbi:methionine/alanine import family NSS transporter small subunit [Agromyces sp. SYSU T00194]|uniref:methionine/alanine import family NSS transporter small subunit n=1 Tax=Agromyces chitinivorans TaxID=3158560 RepID=UPI0033962429
MSGVAIAFLVIALLVVWGGLTASIVYLRHRPEAHAYPPGGEDDHREDEAPIEHDT